MMKYSQQIGMEKSDNVNRRTLLKNAAALGAFGLTASIPLCGFKSVAAASGLMQEPQIQERELNGYRLYAIKHAEQAIFDGTLRPHVLWVNWFAHSQDRAKIEEIGFNYVTWASALSKSEHIESLSAVEQEDVAVFGAPENANGKLTVRLFPNAAEQFEGEFASTVDIVSQWKQELDNVEGIVITAPNEGKNELENAQNPNQLPLGLGQPPVKGLILIEFAGELDETVLATITSHPQTLLIQWGEMIVQHHCPGCGMG